MKVLPLVILGSVAVSYAPCNAAISLLKDVPYSQNFNSLASSLTSSTMPVDWAFSESGTNANATYTAGTGSGNAGDTYSFGSTSATDRALGSLRSGSLVSTLGAQFTNNTGSGTIDLSVIYVGEQWRRGGSGNTDSLQFSYSTNATSLTTGTWTSVSALNFSSRDTTNTISALDGNATANRASVSSSINGIALANGASFWIRWTDFDVTGADDGLAIDDFSITAVPEPTAAFLGSLGLLGLLRRRR